jgi:uncharacterized repeat protein (TIGR03803 family)
MRSKNQRSIVTGILLLCLAASIQAQTFSLQHSFTNTPDGKNPVAPVWVNGLLYGGTQGGGTGQQGSIFSFNTNGQVLAVNFSFTGTPSTGFGPNNLLATNNMIYGTASGGTNNYGLVFALNLGGSGFRTIYSFDGTNGGNPKAAPLLVGNTLFGTAGAVNATNCGVVFKVNTNGSGYTILHMFTNAPDGYSPEGALSFDGIATLYGAASGSGSGGCVVFAVDTNGGNYRILHTFTNVPDGFFPFGGVVLNNGVLYGTTQLGGTNSTGTIFSINTNGTGYQVLYNFGNFSTDGVYPKAELLFDGGYLYGGTITSGRGGGGTLFRLSSNGSGFTVIHSFTNSSAGGSYLSHGVIKIGSVLFGSTYQGGISNVGTLFSEQLSPVITAQPQNASATNGLSASFTVTATDETVTNYQWFFNTSTLLAGQTSRTLTLNNVTNGNAGPYTVVVSDNFGSVTSTPATLTVVSPPVITQQPQSITATNGNSVSFTNAATGTATIYYYWFFNTNTFLAANTTGIYTINPVATNSRGYYSVIVSNAYGTTNSSAALLTVVVPLIKPAITQSPLNYTVTNGYNAYFTNVATGTDPLSYQWYFNTNTAVAGGTNPILAVPFALTNNAGYYRVIVTNAAGAATSSAALLTVVSTKPIIFVQPQNLTVTLSNSANFSVTAAGLNPLRYQWYISTVSTSLGSLLTSQTNSSISFSTTANSNGKYYSVVITNTMGKATSSPALLTVASAPLIATNPQPLTVNVGDTAAFSVAAFGPTLAYQWYSNSVNTAIGTPLAGQTASTLSFTAATVHNGRFFSVVITNIYGKATSSPPALLTVNLAAGQPKLLNAAIVAASKSFSLTLSNTASSVNRVWACTNLISPAWTVVGSNTLPGSGLWTFTDTNILKTNQVRFYRASCP